MANRIFDLPETKGTFQVKGLINGVAKEKFYTSKKTKNNKDFKAVNFGCEYQGQQTVYLNLNGMPQKDVYFSKRDVKTQKTETKAVPWTNRKTFAEDGYRMIGVNLGLTKTVDKEGKPVNDRKTMHSFDACDYIRDNLKDKMSTFIKGNLEYSSYFDNDGNIHRGIKYVPSQISLCKDVDFAEYSENNKPVHDFTQQIVFMGIEPEQNDGKNTGRFVVSAKIVTYSDIVDTEFFITDAKLANLFRKNLKPYYSIVVHGKIAVTHKVQETSEEDTWGEENAMNTVSGSTKTEMIITGATPSTIERETYTEKTVAAAIKAIRNAKTAEQNFSGTTKTEDVSDDAWGDDGFGEDDSEPW